MRLFDPRSEPRATFAALRPMLAPSVRFDALWVAGDLAGLATTTIAIVGSRAPSEAGRRLAFETARTLARADLCIVSGLALGIDGAAHLGALEAGGATVGVLGGGHRCFHPKKNRALAERMIAANGAVVSPFPPDHAAFPAQFLQRNGIVAALADAVVIVEAAARSGALNTASWAADLGIPVFAFPGDVDRPKVAGCLALLRDGATLVRDAWDILGDLGMSERQTANAATSAAETAVIPAGTSAQGSAPAAALLAILREGERDLDTLLERIGGAAPETLSALNALEIAGTVERRPGQRYALVARDRR
jgi:DNA processing protein